MQSPTVLANSIAGRAAHDTHVAKNWSQRGHTRADVAVRNVMTRMAGNSVILGISDSHDASAVVIRDGRLVAAINEERLDRRKMSAGTPVLSAAAVLRAAGLSGRDVTRVAVAGRISVGQMPINNDFSLDDGSYTWAQRVCEAVDSIPGLSSLARTSPALRAYRALMPSLGRARLKRIQAMLAELDIATAVAADVTAYDHHDCHLASAYYASGEPDCLVVSNDGFGDALCCKVALGHSGRLDVVSSNSFFNSLGVYYNYASHLCGFPKAHHVGKTTGLAAFGDPTRTIDTFRKLARWDEGQGRYVNDGPVFRHAINALQRELVTVRREDIAAGVQRHAEDVLVAMVRHFMRKTGRKRILLVGGVHANVKVNQRIAEIEGVERVAVFPNMGDGGLAAGAAWLAWAEKNQPGELPPRLADVYLGPQPPSEHELSDCLQAAGLAVTRPPDLPQAVAESLAAGKIVARFDGRMEYGPRALGNRSILYAATDASVNTWLNHQLKRTEFMPFAPVVRAEDASDFLANLTASSAYTAQFMTITYDVTKRCRLEAPAVVHVDGTARPQVIHREVNPGYYDILTAYQRVTGLSVLVNTSFNMHEEPIVCSLQDAIRSFRTSSVDVLAAGPFLIDSPVQPPARVSAAGQASR